MRPFTLRVMGLCPSCGVELTSAPKFCPECGTRLGPAATSVSEARKTVTVLFSDVAGSTALGEALDPEAVRGLMGRYFAAMKTVIERHGGTVEKFIGDAVMAVFGIPAIHEDDALRAVRAAVQMREALAALNVELAAERGVTITTRTGITTGEVVAGDPAAGQTLVTGDTVNTAARLEQAAGAGEILIGAPTWQLVRDAVRATPVESVSAKGKALPVPAYRLESVSAGSEGHLRRFDAPLVGRERELARLTQTFRDAVEQRSPQLFTLLGAAGVGKSRLVREFLAAVEGDARILRGRCLPYGEGITYWPLAEAIKDAADISESDDRAGAQRRLLTLLDGERDAELLAARLATAIGLSDDPAPQTELFWAVRRTLEHLARQQPLVVVWEDIHWAEPTFLDLVDHLADWSREAPLVLLTPARPELLDARPAWGGGKLNASTVLLEALPAEAAGRLIDALPGGTALPQSLRERIATAAEGNPLFVEEMLAMLVDDGTLQLADGGAWQASGEIEQLAIPPTIQALLAARLDRLSVGERQVAARASVVGRIFEPEAVAALSSEADGAPLNERLMALVRKELVRPDRSEVTGGDAFKFRHILIRDAAYAALPKSERADLHERFAAWLEHAAGDRIAEFGDIVGHHLEEAHRYRVELGEPSAGVAARAVDWLTAAAWRAWERTDWPAAAGSFGRAAAMASTPAERLELLETSAWSLRLGGRYAAAIDAAKTLAAAAEEVGDEPGALRAALLEVDSETVVDDAAIPRLEALVASVRARANELADRRTATHVAYLGGTVDEINLLYDDAYLAYRGVLDEALTNGWRPLALAVARPMLLCAQFGSAPITNVRAEASAVTHQLGGMWRASEAQLLEAGCEILVGGHAAAQSRIRAAITLYEEQLDSQGMAYHYAVWANYTLLTGDPEPAAELASLAVSVLRGAGVQSPLLTSVAVEAETFVLLGRLDHAAALLAEAATADPSDVITHVIVQRATSRLELARGNAGPAQVAIEQASALLEGVQSPLDQAEILVAWSEVHRAAGETDKAREALEQARQLVEKKGALAVVRRIDALLSEL